jgi:hypothetical protein
MCSTAAPTVPLGTVIRRSSAAKSTARAASLAAARADDVELAVGPMRRMWEQCGQWSRRHGVSELMRLISASRAAARVRRYRTSFSSANEVISQARRFSGLSGRLRVNDKPRKGRSTQWATRIAIVNAANTGCVDGGGMAETEAIFQSSFLAHLSGLHTIFSGRYARF